MSKYTTQVLQIVKSYSNPNDSIYKRIETALPKIFDFDFPIYKESYRTTLERKIIMHYLQKEIGLETVALWKLFLCERLNLIMPYYNQLYETTEKEYDYFIDVDFTESHTERENNTEKIDTKSNSNIDSNNTTNFTGEEVREDSENINTTIAGKENSTEKIAGTENERNTGTVKNEETTEKDITKTNISDVTKTENESGQIIGENTSTKDITKELSENTNDTKDINSTRTIDDSENGTSAELTTGQKTNENSISNSTNGDSLESDLPQSTMNGYDYATKSMKSNGTSTQSENSSLNENNSKDITNNTTKNSVDSLQNTETTTISKTENETGKETTSENTRNDTTKDFTGSENNTSTETGKENSSLIGTRTDDLTRGKENEETTENETTKNETNETNATKSGKTTETNESTNQENRKIENTENTGKTGTIDIVFTHSKIGLSGSHTKTELLQEYRQAIINIDKMIIDELYDLFMLVY